MDPRRNDRNMKKQFELDEHDNVLVEQVRKAIKEAYSVAHSPPGVARRMQGVAINYKMRGRTQAMKRYPFAGICEASGLPLERSIAALDELDPLLGYSGPLRWVCAKANGNGRGTCGKC